MPDVTEDDRPGSGRAAHAVAVLDRCPSLGRVIELIVREHRPGTLVRAFADAVEAERWVAAADAPVLVIAGVEVGPDVAERAAAWSSAAGPVRLVLLAADDEHGCAPATTPRPTRLVGWRACLDDVLAAEGAWHTGDQWRTAPGPGAPY